MRSNRGRTRAASAAGRAGPARSGTGGVAPRVTGGSARARSGGSRRAACAGRGGASAACAGGRADPARAGTWGHAPRRAPRKRGLAPRVPGVAPRTQEEGLAPSVPRGPARARGGARAAPRGQEQGGSHRARRGKERLVRARRNESACAGKGVCVQSGKVVVSPFFKGLLTSSESLSSVGVISLSERGHRNAVF